MENITNLSTEAQDVTDVHVINAFLHNNYEFRENELSHKMEVRSLTHPQFKELTDKTLNSIVINAEMSLPDTKVSKSKVCELIYCEETQMWNPIQDYLNNLPKWDGHNRVTELFSRLPGATAEHIYRLSIWMRSVVAHWKQIDELHGNELVPTLIGGQGCGKTTFCKMLLPQHLRQYVLDHLNFGNKFDKEMALTNNLFVILDEIEQIKPNQYAELKYTLSRNRVTSREIYAHAQTDRQRFASFIATTNTPQPLNDPTGSRRFICIAIPENCNIYNSEAIDYDQLYAQLVEEVIVQKQRYWLTQEEIKQMENDNLPFQHQLNLDEIVDTCFRLPNENECTSPMSIQQILDVITKRYTYIPKNRATEVNVGKALRSKGYKKHHLRSGNHYYAVLR